ncbi:MAG: DUF1592 domain-containing protein [Planctomycetia bacterium]|nr:DUF1592 domain-containing protein [Planctomycetia bacterium]
MFEMNLSNRFASPALFLAGALSLLLTVMAETSPSAPPPAVGDKAFRGFIRAQCYACHDTENKEAGLALDTLDANFDDKATFDKWTHVFDRMRSGEMPPPEEPRPDAKELTAHLDTLSKALYSQNLKEQTTQGRTILRRLNRVEYQNSVHELLGIETPIMQILPQDMPQHGFDTVADGLRLSQLHMEKYLEAADLALDAAIRLTAAPIPIKQRYLYKENGFVLEQLKSEHPQVLELADGVVLFTLNNNNRIAGKQGYVHIYEGGFYRLRVSAYGYQTQRPLMLALQSAAKGRYDLVMLGFFDVQPDKPKEVEITARLGVGDFIVPTPLDLELPADGKHIYEKTPQTYTGPGVVVQWIEVEGPILKSWPPPSVAKIFGDTPLKEIPANKQLDVNGTRRVYELVPGDAKADVKSLIEQFATRAFRRPLETGEADSFVKLATNSLDAGRTFEDAMRVGLRAVLVAPQFLLFDEKPGKLNDYALATRLAYFLWSEPPDDELLLLAAAKKLAQPGMLRAQTERMLASPKAQGFTRNFLGQWLDIRNIDATRPDLSLYPEYNESLKVSMVAETEAFFNEILQKNLSVNNFINSDFVMINRCLAEAYNIPNVVGQEIQKVALPADSVRGGVLTQAAVLKVTANGTITSPVLRGAWVLKRLFGITLPPPPPNVGAIEPDTRDATTIREQLAKHSTLESCAGCHAQMDPPGFALESFDVIGGWRDRYRSKAGGDPELKKLLGRTIWEYKLRSAVDATGELPDGRKFADVREFKTLIMEQQDQVAEAIIGKLLTYGTGAGVQFADRWVVEDVLKKAKAQNLGLRTIVHEVVQSSAFGSK